jgi:hypothetical protein
MQGAGSGKKRLLLLTGAGASLDFGLPSVAGVNSIINAEAQKHFSLVHCSRSNLYEFVEKKIAKCWKQHTRAGLKNHPNFEDVLYALSSLTSLYDTGIFTSVLRAFSDPPRFPRINFFGQPTNVG